AYFRAHPGFVQLWFAHRGPALTEMAHAFDSAWAERLWHFLIERKLLGRETPQYVLQFVFEMGHRPFDVAFQRSPMDDDATIDEARRMLTAYLETYAPAVPRRASLRVLTVRRGPS